MARLILPAGSDPWLALREPALLVPNRLPAQLPVPKAGWASDGLSAAFVAQGGGLVELNGTRPSTEAKSGSRVILGQLGPEYSGGSGVNTRFANSSRYAPIDGSGFTVVAWFDVDTLSNYSAIAAHQESTTTQGWELRLGGTGGLTGSDIAFINANTSNRTFRTATPRYAAGQKQAFIAVSRVGNLAETVPIIHWGTGWTNSLSVVGGATGEITAPTTRDLYVGHRYDNVTRLDGAVGMLLIYKRALSVAELDALYRQGPQALFKPAANDPIFIGAAGGAAGGTITADFLDSASALYEPTLGAGAATLTADFLSSAAALYDPTLTAASATVSADFIDSAAALYEPTLVPGAATLLADFIASSAIVYDPSLTGTATLTADFLDSAAALYEPTLFGGSTIAADFLNSAAALYQPTLVPGAATLSADFLNSAAVIYNPSISSGLFIDADFLDSAAEIYNPQLVAAVWSKVASASTTWTPTSPASTIWTEI